MIGPTRTSSSYLVIAMLRIAVSTIAIPHLKARHRKCGLQQGKEVSCRENWIVGMHYAAHGRMDVCVLVTAGVNRFIPKNPMMRAQITHILMGMPRGDMSLEGAVASAFSKMTVSVSFKIRDYNVTS